MRKRKRPMSNPELSHRDGIWWLFAATQLHSCSSGATGWVGSSFVLVVRGDTGVKFAHRETCVCWMTADDREANLTERFTSLLFSYVSWTTLKLFSANYNVHNKCVLDIFRTNTQPLNTKRHPRRLLNQPTSAVWTTTQSQVLYRCTFLKGTVHAKMKILLSCTHSDIILNIYDFICFSAEHKRSDL